MASKELTGVVSIDLRNEPQFPFDPSAAATAAQSLTVRDEESYAIAARMIQESAACIAKVEAFYEEDKTLAYRLHKSICDKVTKFTASWRTVRPLLEQKMKTYRAEQERIRREEEQRIAREAEQARLLAEAEARRISEEADRKADELRRSGEMKAAREVIAEAAVQAETVVETADSLADLGVIAPAAEKVQGVQESRPWKGEITNLRTICKAIGDGVVPLEWLTPVRGQGEQMLPLVEVNMGVLHNIAKRMGSENLGIPGTRGIRDVVLSFSTKTGPIVSAAQVEPREDGW